MRAAAFIDGFNLYHAIHDHGVNHLKWLNLWSLANTFAPSPQFDLTAVYYFSAYATWRPGAYARHREYVKALRATGVTAVLGRFKEKDRNCFRCRSRWKDHEEKETDVNIALYLLNEVVHDRYDRALLISGDSDLAPAVRMVRSEFPNKEIRIVAPIGRNYSMDLVNAAGGLSTATQMYPIHVERNLFPKEVRDSGGAVLATRPPPYDPPN